MNCNDKGSSNNDSKVSSNNSSHSVRAPQGAGLSSKVKGGDNPIIVPINRAKTTSEKEENRQEKINEILKEVK